MLIQIRSVAVFINENTADTIAKMGTEVRYALFSASLVHVVSMTTRYNRSTDYSNLNEHVQFSLSFSVTERDVWFLSSKISSTCEGGG
jgi:hypothetical protein